MTYDRLWLIFLHPKIGTLFLHFFEDFQIRVPDSRLDTLRFCLFISISMKCMFKTSALTFYEVYV